MDNKKRIFKQIKSKYFPLIKSLQTGLLLITGLAGYMSARCPVMNMSSILALTGSLVLSISGSTALNMWYDRDIDAKMPRTSNRPLSTGETKPREALIFGLLLSIIGIGWALAIDPLYGIVVFAGLFFDVVVYTIWLKRRTAWSIVWGGISGGMPVLAGRVLGIGYIDWVGIALSKRLQQSNHSPDYRYLQRVDCPGDGFGCLWSRYDLGLLAVDDCFIHWFAGLSC